MKFIKTLFIIIFLLVVLMGVGGFIFVKTFDANKYKDQITAQMSKALQRPVNMERIDLKLSAANGATLEVINLDVEKLVKVESTYLTVDLMHYARTREISVPKVILRSPRIEFDPAVPLPGADTSKSTVTQTDGANTAASSSSPDEIPDFRIKKVRIENGTFHYTDSSAAKPIDVRIHRLDVELNDVALDKPFDYKLSCALLSDKQQSLDLNGKATYFSKSGEIQVNDLRIDAYLKKMSLDQLFKAVPDLEVSGLKAIDDGQLTLNLNEIVLQPNGQPKSININGQLVNMVVRVIQLNGPIKVNSNFTMDESVIQLDQTKVELVGGAIKLIGNVSDYLGSINYDLATKVSDLDLTKLIDPKALPVKISGLVQGEFTLIGQGVDENAIRSNLRGQGSLEVIDGRIVDRNLLGIVVNQLSWFPNFSSRFKSNLSPKYQERIKADDTVLNRVAADIKIGSGNVQLNRIQLDADGFVYSANGQVDFDQNLALSSSFYFDQDLSDTMLKMEEELSALLDNSGQIRIPFKDYQGKADKYSVALDSKGLFKQGVANRGKTELKKVLFKALDIDEQSSPQVEGSLSDGLESNLSEPKEVSTEEVLIENVLDAIPLFK